MHVEHPVVRTGFAEQSAKLERRRAEKRLANTARRETGCKIDWDFRSDPRTVTAPPGRGVRSLFLWRDVGRQPPTSHPPHVRRRWDIRTPPNTVLDTPSDRYKVNTTCSEFNSELNFCSEFTTLLRVWNPHLRRHRHIELHGGFRSYPHL